MDELNKYYVTKFNPVKISNVAAACVTFMFNGEGAYPDDVKEYVNQDFHDALRETDLNTLFETDLYKMQLLTRFSRIFMNLYLDSVTLIL
jgi:hypothetical protein